MAPAGVVQNVARLNPPSSAMHLPPDRSALSAATMGSRSRGAVVIRDIALLQFMSSSFLSRCNQSSQRCTGGHLRNPQQVLPNPPPADVFLRHATGVPMAAVRQKPAPAPHPPLA